MVKMGIPVFSCSRFLLGLVDSSVCNVAVSLMRLCHSNLSCTRGSYVFALFDNHGLVVEYVGGLCVCLYGALMRSSIHSTHAVSLPTSDRISIAPSLLSVLPFNEHKPVPVAQRQSC